MVVKAHQGILTSLMSNSVCLVEWTFCSEIENAKTSEAC